MGCDSPFGAKFYEERERHGEDVDDYSMCICGRPMDGHPEPTEQES